MSPAALSPKQQRRQERTRAKECAAITETILQARREKAAALAATEARLTTAEWDAWQQDLGDRVDHIQHNREQGLGFIEEDLARASREPLRLLAERTAQAKANAIPCTCSRCQRELTHQRVLHRWIESRFGRLSLYRPYGYCPTCQEWQFPADLALGLQKHSPASPYLQEVVALLNTKMPSEQAVEVAHRFGLDLSRCFLHREAHRQGLRAQDLRQARLAQLDSLGGLQSVALGADTPGESAPFTLVIEIDAWNIRERDDWGRTEQARQEALAQHLPAPSKWHWVYVATVFRLDHRGLTAGGRPIISQRGYVATREGVEPLLRQLYREAIDRGLAQARDVLVIADGALWIWNAVADRFPQARSRLDLYHADQHLWAVANDLHHAGTPEARRWVEPLLRQLRQEKPTAVIASLKEVATQVGDQLREKVQARIAYFENHQQRLDYRDIVQARQAVEEGGATPEQQTKAAEPLGSGAVESTCRQYQCRFKRTGQFWSRTGDEALMCLETLWRNGRWHLLFPHAKPPSPANN